MADRGARRTYAATVLAGVAAGGLMFLAASRTWASVEVSLPGMTASDVSTTGSTATPLVSAMAFVVMAGSVAVVASGGWLRRAIGVMVLAAGGIAAFSAATAGAAIDDAMNEAIASSASMVGGPEEQAALVDAAETTMWRWASFAAACVAVAAGAMIAVYGHRWPRMGQKYESPASSRRPKSQAPPAERDYDDLWKALDEGDDPTV